MAAQGREENREGNSEMNGNGKSDSPIVPEKVSNKDSGAPEPAEKLEGRGLAQGKSRRFPKHRTQSRGTLRRNMWRIRQAAETRKEERFTSLWHHIHDPNRLHESYYAINRKGSPGADKVSWESYGEQLWGNLSNFSIIQGKRFRNRQIKLDTVSGICFNWRHEHERRAQASEEYRFPC